MADLERFDMLEHRIVRARIGVGHGRPESPAAKEGITDVAKTVGSVQILGFGEMSQASGNDLEIGFQCCGGQH